MLMGNGFKLCLSEPWFLNFLAVKIYSPLCIFLATPGEALVTVIDFRVGGSGFLCLAPSFPTGASLLVARTLGNTV